MTNATSFERTAAIGAVRPAKLCPMIPIRFGFTSGRVLRKATPATKSPASCCTDDNCFWPDDLPAPRSSTPQHDDPVSAQGIGDGEE